MLLHYILITSNYTISEDDRNDRSEFRFINNEIIYNVLQCTYTIGKRRLYCKIASDTIHKTYSK